ncbi:hypothetical protein DYU11_07275 [Fibrisoma montanum]|uniref:Uncharacterized protein n=1 Tax=Fibrisoma montanum TaxID=2305895 RepID=A0A418MEH1_9BACT|nr:hypothetical protein [Fibrisoma montanum]RIV25113.1 hypothetical protein DYU11_07275 [Fibrisoma montanum]
MVKIVLISLSAVLQLLACGLFVHEAKTTTQGWRHRIQYGLAALVFLAMGLMLIWFLLVEPLTELAA